MCLGRERRKGSVSIVGAVSPAGGDFSEPITQHSLRLAGTFWALDTSLARQRHFPAINWIRSYSLYELDAWFEREVAPDWQAQRAWALDLLQRETSLLEIVQIPRHRLARAGRAGRARDRAGCSAKDFLQQSAFDDVDAYCSLAKQHTMLNVDSSGTRGDGHCRRSRRGDRLTLDGPGAAELRTCARGQSRRSTHARAP